VCVISGGNIDTNKLVQALEGKIPQWKAILIFKTLLILLKQFYMMKNEFSLNYIWHCLRF
jgi:hypothetical protein